MKLKKSRKVENNMEKNYFYEKAAETTENISKEITEVMRNSEWIKEIKKHEGTVDIFSEEKKEECKKK